MAGKSKETQQKKAATKKATGGAGGGDSGKQKRKKWSKGRINEKAANKAYFDKNPMNGLQKSVTKTQCITVNKVINDLKVKGSMARIGLRSLAAQGLITAISTHPKCMIYVPAVQTAQPKVVVNK
jgi:small subunit ribosomal protein S25e